MAENSVGERFGDKDLKFKSRGFCDPQGLSHGLGFSWIFSVFSRLYKIGN